MVFGKCDNNLSIKMNDVTLKDVLCSKHLETILSSKPKDDVVTYEDRLSVARRTTYGLLSIGDKKKLQSIPHLLLRYINSRHYQGCYMGLKSVNYVVNLLKYLKMDTA